MEITPQTKQISIFLKNILTMFRGTLIAQIIAVIGAIYLAKIYGEEAYGILGFFVSVISITSIISTLQLDKCIVISKNKNESVNWFHFLQILVPLITIVIFIFLWIFSELFLETKLSLHFIFLSIIGTLLVALNSIHESLFTYKKEFSTISNSKIFLTIGNVAFQIVLIYKFELVGLVYGFILSQLFLSIFYYFKNSKEISKINFQEIKNGIRQNDKIIKFLLPSNVINSLAINLMPILILTFFSAKEAGVYFFSLKILGTPLFLISASVAPVFFQKSSELIKKNKEELLKITKKIVFINLLLMLSFLILMNTIGIYILEVYFGKSWENLRLFNLILSILILARTSFNPISSLIVVLDRNFESLVFNIYLFLINLIAIYFGYLYHDIVITMYILSIFGGIGYLLLLAYFLNLLKTN